MAKYQKYAEYKNSGIEWLGDIPSHWAMSKLRYLFDFSKGLSITKENLQDEGIPCVNYGEVHSKYGFEVNPKKHPLKYVSESYLKTSENALLNIGDFIFADTSEDLKGSGNFTHLVGDERIFAGYHTVIARPHNANSSRFYAYLFDSKEFRSQIQLAVKGVKVFSITQAMLRSADAWLPSPDEQIKIANFLDHETAQIDSLIAKQEKLIELLKEKRQAVISHAVTKGLNPDVAMKDSGVEWLGQVPEHWTVSKLKYFSSIQGGFAFSSDLFIEEGTQVLRIGNVYQNSLSLERQPIFISNDLVKNFQDFIVKKNDVLMSLTGTLGKRDYGFAIKVETDDLYLLNQRVAKISPNKNIDTDFMVYVLWSESYLTQLYSLPSGTKQANLSNSDVLGIEIVVPPTMEEQKRIARYLKEKTEKFDEMISKAESAIQLMQERRTALISSAVTGKINVSKWQKTQEAHTV